MSSAGTLPDLVRIDSASSSDAEAWDDFVAGAPGSTYAHLSGWAEINRTVLRHEPVSLIARDPDGRIRGVLPMIEVKSPLGGHRLLSMPFINHGGPLAEEPAIAEALARRALELADDRGVASTEFRTAERSPRPLHTVDRKVTVRFDLPADPDLLWKSTFRAKLRSQIRRPIKAGMTTRFGADQIDAFYEVFAENMRDLGTPVLSREFFVALQKNLPDLVVFGTVWHESKPVAAGCGFVWHGEFEITWASSLRRHSREAPNMLLYWSFMQEMIRRGVSVFDFGRCTPDGGTHRFKVQWGGETSPLHWGVWPPEDHPGGPDAEQGFYRQAVRAWQRLPLSVANRLGPHVARHFP